MKTKLDAVLMKVDQVVGILVLPQTQCHISVEPRLEKSTNNCTQRQLRRRIGDPR
jgi:hypothetical protein